jgi:DNA-binding protein HU-beta
MAERFTFNELVEDIAGQSGAPKSRVKALLSALAEEISTTLQNEGKIHLSGLGSFQLEAVPERQGRNPQTGATITIPPHSRIKFKPDADARRFINRQYEHLNATFLDDDSTPVSPTTSATQNQAKTAAMPATAVTEPERPKTAEHIPITDGSGKKYPFWIWLLPLLILIIIFWFWLGDPAPLANAEDPATALSSEITALRQEEAAIDSELVAIAAEKEKLEAEIAAREAGQTKETSLAQAMEVLPGEHLIVSGDNLWSIAASTYNNNYLWTNIYAANLGTIENPDFLPEAATLRLPGVYQRGLLSDERDIEATATAYLQTYRELKRLESNQAIYYLWVAWQLDAELITAEKQNISAADLSAAQQKEGTIRFIK